MTHTTGIQYNQLTTTDQKRCVGMLDENARTDIETFCRTGEKQVEASGIVLWWDISKIPTCPTEREIVQNAIWWCALRGLFTRHTNRHHWVRFNTQAREQYEKTDEFLELPPIIRHGGAA